MKIGFNRIILITVAALILVWILFSLSFHGIKALTIDEFSKQQMLIAEEAARGITGFMEDLAGELEYISGIDDVYEFNADGEKIIQRYSIWKGNMVKSITRVDEKGRILWIFPYDRRYKGADISSQEHVSYLLSEHKTVVSDVFISIQGIRAIAVHVPVQRNGKFRGSIAVLIDFEFIPENYLKNIRMGEGGYAWMISEKGVILYSPVPGHSGKSVYEVFHQFPELLAVSEKMMRGEKGSTSYDRNFMREKPVETHKTQVSFIPVNIMNTRWSIAVTTPREQILSIMDGLRNKLIIVAFLFMIINIAFIYFILQGVRLKDEIRRKRKYETFLIENETFLETALNSAGEVAAGIAHDLNNVLAGIINSTEVIEMRHKGDEKSEKYTGFIKDTASRGTGLVQKIINLSLMGNSARSFVDVHQIIEEAGFVVTDAGGSVIKLKTRLEAGNHKVKASPLNLRKIIIRLASRISSAAQESRGLLISTENIIMENTPAADIIPQLAAGAYLKISMKSISAKTGNMELVKLFHFLKVKTGPDDNTDPGISDIYRRIRNSGGAMTIEAPDGETPAISVFLPVSKSEEGGVAGERLVASKPGGTILVIEDDPVIKSALNRILADLGYNVWTAADGMAGIEVFRKECKKIDLVILDIVMPVKGGMETLKEIMAIDHDALVYMTSGYITGANLDEIMSQGAAGFLSKPVSVADLSSVVSKALAEKKKGVNSSSD